jgi:hypothetical protein
VADDYKMCAFGHFRCGGVKSRIKKWRERASGESGSGRGFRQNRWDFSQRAAEIGWILVELHKTRECFGVREMNEKWVSIYWVNGPGEPSSAVLFTFTAYNN